MREVKVTITVTTPGIIRLIRGSKTQEELAQIIGVTHSTISQWETGKLGLSIDSLFALAAYARKRGRPELADALLRAQGGEGAI